MMSSRITVASVKFRPEVKVTHKGRERKTRQAESFPASFPRLSHWGLHMEPEE